MFKSTFESKPFQLSNHINVICVIKSFTKRSEHYNNLQPENLVEIDCGLKGSPQIYENSSKYLTAVFKHRQIKNIELECLKVKFRVSEHAFITRILLWGIYNYEHSIANSTKIKDS